MSLHSVWYVDADNSYIIKPNAGSGKVALRTLTGSGTVIYKDGRVLSPDANSLLFFDFAEIAEYRCVDKKWRFWWFEFDTHDVFEFVMDQTFTVLPIPDEGERLNQIFLSLHSYGAAYSKLATAGFCYLLYEYGLNHQIRQQNEPYLDCVNKIITLMNERLERPLTVSEMADAANMSDRNFRKIFKRITGRSPKIFYNKLRMQHARDLLRRGYSVSRVSHLLGFSSPFCFSNAYKEHFGLRPSDTVEK
ncbi:helix-turn-helix transcriptional regulator [Anaerohalosphaera lusitana]|nr:response regulator transcription factor [Anaerohalosphaera lusitana]